MKYIKKILLIFVFIEFSVCSAGSFEDYFSAIKRNDLATVTSLLQRGFDPNSRDEAGDHGLFLALKSSSWAVADALINAPKIDLEARNAKDESALMIAVLKGQLVLAEKLIDKGADVNKPGWTPLHYAATLGHVPLINLLLDHDAYIDASSPNDSTPLMMAAMYGTPQAVKVLLESGADPTIKNASGLTALDFSYRAQSEDSAQIISAFIRGRQPKGQW